MAPNRERILKLLLEEDPDIPPMTAEQAETIARLLSANSVPEWKHGWSSQGR